MLIINNDDVSELLTIADAYRAPKDVVDQALKAVKTGPPRKRGMEGFSGEWKGLKKDYAHAPVETGVTVEVLDQNWSSGQKLQSFEIVGDETGAGPRIFTVKLKTAKGEQTVKYYVVGIDPLWVYSEADYKKQMGG